MPVHQIRVDLHKQETRVPRGVNVFTSWLYPTFTLRVLLSNFEIALNRVLHVFIIVANSIRLESKSEEN